jgi:hypothetical protein
MRRSYFRRARFRHANKWYDVTYPNSTTDEIAIHVFCIKQRLTRQQCLEVLDHHQFLSSTSESALYALRQAIEDSHGRLHSDVTIGDGVIIEATYSQRDLDTAVRSEAKREMHRTQVRLVT